MKKLPSAAVINEVDALEEYVDQYLQWEGLTYEQWVERYGQDTYLARNQIILQLLKPLQPKRIFEFACAGGFLAKLLLENIVSVERYTCSNFSPRMVEYCTQQLSNFSNCEVKLVDANVVRSKDIEHANMERYDTFLTTSFEHIEHDQDLIKRFPENRNFVFGVAGFDDPEHFRMFSGPEDIIDRYSAVLSIVSIAALGESNQKYVVMSRTRRATTRNAS